MWWIPLVAVVGVAVTVGAVVGVRRRREVEPSREAALRAIRGLSRDSRRQRGQRARGTGEHFGRTPVKKYSDERQDPSDATLRVAFGAARATAEVPAAATDSGQQVEWNSPATALPAAARSL